MKSTICRLAVAVAVAVSVTAALVVIPPPSSASAAQTGDTTLVSHHRAGPTVAPTGTSCCAMASADGRFVVFASDAIHLVPGQVDNNNNFDVFLFERATGKVTLVSHVPGIPTQTGNGASGMPSVSADGGYIAFQSDANDLVTANYMDPRNVFLYERVTGSVALVSHRQGEPSLGMGGYTYQPGEDFQPSISADGGFVVYRSDTSYLYPHWTFDPNQGADIFLYQRATGQVTLVSSSVATDNTGNKPSPYIPSISDDGAFVAFVSDATDLVVGQESNDGPDVFLFERTTGTVSLVSHLPGGAGATGNGVSVDPVVSGDGSSVAFISDATNLVAGQSDGNGREDVFLYDRGTNSVRLVSHRPESATTTSERGSFAPVISKDGSAVAFGSGRLDLPSAPADVFLYDTATGAVSLVSHTPGSATTTGNGQSQVQSISGDGKVVLFQSRATNLVANQDDANGSFAGDLFLLETASGAISLVSHSTSGPTTTGNGESCCGSITPDGKVVVFQSLANNLVAGTDTNGVYDVFLYERAASMPCSTAPADFDGDGDSDISVFRSSSGVWYTSSPASSVVFGSSGDIPVPGDYDGDGNVDHALFRPSNGVWYLDSTPPASVVFGTDGDIPVPADYNGDGKTDIAVFRPATSVWYIQSPASSVVFGSSGDIPVPGDYSGDGKAEIAVFRPSTGVWYLNGPMPSSPMFGADGDIPVPADYNGDGKTDIAVFRPSNGVWYIGGPAPASIPFGTAGDQPQPGDYNGDGKADIAVFRPSTSVWYIQNPASSVVFGASGDIALPLPDAVRRLLQ